VTLWLPVPGYEGTYEVSDRGLVRSLDRYEVLTGTRGGVRHRRGRVLHSFTMKTEPYLYVRLSKDGQAQTRTVHSIVLEAFAGPRLPGQECRHGVGGPRDNRWPENICWGSKSENTFDQVEHGTHHHSRKKKCPRGHEYDYIVPGTNRRQCRKCQLITRELRQAVGVS